MQDIICYFPGEDDFKLAKRLSIEIILGGYFDKKQIVKLKNEYSATKICAFLKKPDVRTLQRLRNAADLVAVEGKTLKLSHFAVQQNADILLHPLDSKKLYFDIGIAATLASRKKTLVALNFTKLLNADEADLSMQLKNIFFLAKILRKYGLPLKIFSCATKPAELRDLKSMRFFLEGLGFSPPQAKKYISLKVKEK